MSTLSNAPLIEVIYEMRWGAVKRVPGGQVEITLAKDDENLLSGRFSKLAEEDGFVVHENINAELPIDIPHIVRHRFRKHANTWPCFQVGTGIFTVNQLNDGYDWDSFRKTVLLGLSILSHSHPKTMEKLPIIGMELRYQDGFFLPEGEEPLEFLKSKMAFDFRLPSSFTSLKELTNKVDGTSIGFQIPVTQPNGMLMISLVQGLINGKPGFIMDTKVRSTDEKSPAASTAAIDEWLQAAHRIHKHAFETLIQPSYARTFK